MLDAVNSKHVKNLSFRFSLPKKNQSWRPPLIGSWKTKRNSSSVVIVTKVRKFIPFWPDYTDRWLPLTTLGLHIFTWVQSRIPKQLSSRALWFLIPALFGSDLVRKRSWRALSNPRQSSISISTPFQITSLKWDVFIPNFSSTSTYLIGPENVLSIFHFSVSGSQR